MAAAGAAGTLTLMAAPFVAAASVWLYMLVFAFSSLWFAHYALAALAERLAKGRVHFRAARPDFAITHAPGCMVVTDLAA